MPNIGGIAELWDEYCQVKLDVTPHLSDQAKARVSECLAGLPRPIILLHTMGNTSPESKNLPRETTVELYKSLIDQTDGTIVLLDWDNRVPRINTYRIRHIADDWGGLNTEELLALMNDADLLVGVDSGPLHAVRYTDTPAVGIWTRHYPSDMALPRKRTLHVVPPEGNEHRNKFRRIQYNIVECGSGGELDARELCKFCVQMLGPPKYLPGEHLGTDVLLQQFVDWTRGGWNAFDSYPDRHRSYDLVLRESTRRFQSPTMVETGTIRAEEDWAGAGFSTYLFGLYCSCRNGKLYSIDTSPENCQFARAWTSCFGDAVQIRQSDSSTWLTAFPKTIDVLYLDSLDTDHPEHADQSFRELRAALSKLNDQSIIVFDDTPWSCGKFTGKGALGVPWLLERGWRVLYAGYQVVLGREKS